MSIPRGAVKVAHYFYGRGKELILFAHERRIFIRDGRGEIPTVCEGGTFVPHPDEGREFSDFSYEALGLFYDYDMPHVGWDGDH